MNTLLDDDELKRLREMAEGSRPFEESGLWSRMAAKEWKDIKRLPARERLAVGYYVAAERRREQMKEGRNDG
jgi:hypothetical protein